MLRRLLLLAALAALLLGGGRLLLLAAGSSTPDAATGDVAVLPAGQHRAAIVFGAGLRPDGTPSALLRDRIRGAQRLLAERRVDLLLMTGDHSIPGYDEPGAMRRFAIERGTPAAQIAVDYGGRRTWDSCRRARDVFGVRHAVVVSNDFHRARTVAVCKAAGMTVDGAVGTPTDGYALRKQVRWRGRELLASWRGVWDAWIRHPEVGVGGKPIDPYDPCAVWKSLSAEDRAGDARPRGC